MDMQEELALINQFAKTDLTEEQVYTFSVRLCDNEVDRDFERFDGAALERLGELFLGKSGIFDHQWSAERQTARIYRTEVAGRHHGGGRRIPLAEGLGLSAADGEERRPDRGDRGRH